MNIFESLENLNVSEECFEDIIGLVEEYIHEVYTVSDVISAAENSIPLRRKLYIATKADPNSTPEQIKRASDRFESAANVKSTLKGTRFKGTQKLNNTIKSAIKNASHKTTMSTEEKRKRLDDKALERQEELKNTWNRVPSHGTIRPSGFKYGAKLKTTK